MKIKSVRAYWVHIPIAHERQHVSDYGRTLSFEGTIVRIDTECGLTGWGEAKAQVGGMAQNQARLAELGRAPDSVTFGHINFMHIVPTDDEAAALRVQRPLIERIMGTHRSFEHLRTCYFLGTPRRIRARIAELCDAGLEYLALSPLDYDLEQLDSWREEVLRPFRGR